MRVTRLRADSEAAIIAQSPRPLIGEKDETGATMMPAVTYASLTPNAQPPPNAGMRSTYAAG